jgi:hypothetical protein
MTKQDETLRKAYGGIPNEVGPSFDIFDFLPHRPIKYFWLKWIVRKIFR